MSTFSIYDKPSWIPADKLDQVVATSSGWVYTRDDSTTELLASIPNLDTLQIPDLVHVTTDKSTYVLQTDGSIVITLGFSAPLEASTLTSATTLTFTIGETECEAVFTETVDTNKLKFTYTLLGNEIATPSTVSSLTINEITLNERETLTLDYEGYTDEATIDANLVYDFVVEPVSVIKAVQVTPTGTPPPTPTPNYPTVTVTVTSTVPVTETVTETVPVTETVTATVTVTVTPTP